MNQNGLIQVLLIEDDEDDYIIARDVFAEITSPRFSVDWAKTYEAGLEMMQRNQHDVCLVDYRLGAHNGVELIRAATHAGCQAALILLTGAGQKEVDLDAMEAGAADYIVKPQLRAETVERSIRYALQRKRAATLAAFEQARLAAFGAEVGLALARRGSLDRTLERCAQAMVQFLNAAVARISIFDPTTRVFDHRAVAGPVWDRNPNLRAMPEMRFNLEALAEGQPQVIRNLAAYDGLPDKQWVSREGLISAAACPLLLDGHLVGLMTIFTQHTLTEAIAQEMGSVANGVALGVERKRFEAALSASELNYRAILANLKDVVFQMDEQANLTFLNPAWTELTGIEVPSAIGKSFFDFVHPEDRDHSQQVFLDLARSGGEAARYETRIVLKDGTSRSVEVYLMPAGNADRAVAGACGHLTAIGVKDKVLVPA